VTTDLVFVAIEESRWRKLSRVLSNLRIEAG